MCNGETYVLHHAEAVICKHIKMTFSKIEKRGKKGQQMGTDKRSNSKGGVRKGGERESKEGKTYKKKIRL